MVEWIQQGNKGLLPSTGENGYDKDEGNWEVQHGSGAEAGVLVAEAQPTVRGARPRALLQPGEERCGGRVGSHDPVPAAPGIR